MGEWKNFNEIGMVWVITWPVQPKPVNRLVLNKTCAQVRPKAVWLNLCNQRVKTYIFPQPIWPVILASTISSLIERSNDHYS